MNLAKILNMPESQIPRSAIVSIFSVAGSRRFRLATSLYVARGLSGFRKRIARAKSAYRLAKSLYFPTISLYTSYAGGMAISPISMR
jgi:outer membrane protein TolC